MSTYLCVLFISATHASSGEACQCVSAHVLVWVCQRKCAYCASECSCLGERLPERTRTEWEVLGFSTCLVWVGMLPRWVHMCTNNLLCTTCHAHTSSLMCIACVYGVSCTVQKGHCAHIPLHQRCPHVPVCAAACVHSFLYAAHVSLSKHTVHIALCCL